MQSNFTSSRIFYFAIVAILAIASSDSLTAKQNESATAPINWPAEREALEIQFAQELNEIADWCNKNNLARQVAGTLALKSDRDPRRQYIFLPATQLMPDPALHQGDLATWLDKVNVAKRNHAGRIFALAKKAAAENSMAIAYQLIHEVIYHDRDHAAVREMLGHKREETQWKVAVEAFKSRQAKVDHKFLPLTRGEYIIAKTPHFEIESTASVQRTQELAENLERWHGVWRQVFFEYWGSKTTLSDAIAGKKRFRLPTRKFKVVFFKNKQDYVAKLSSLVRGIAVSSGYYSNKQRVSFFYDGGKSERETWRHELTHQLFRESQGRSPDNAFENNYIWLDEGVATYFESMTELDGYVTLGGFDATRIQFARKQALLEKRALPIAQLHALSQAQWQARADADLYSQSASVVDLLMNDGGGTHQQDLVSLLKIIYKRPARPSVFAQKLKVEFADLDTRYTQFLKVDSNTVSNHLLKPESRTYLCLPNAGLSETAFASLGRCENLAELCISQQRIDSAFMNQLKTCESLTKIVLAGCEFPPGALESLAEIPNLVEVNLTYSKFTPEALAALKLKKPRLTVVQ